MSARSVGAFGEFPLIDRLKEIVGDQDIVEGIGDDAAVIDLGGDHFLLATIDMLVENVHFQMERIDPHDLGARALAVNLSDIAAMGGSPTHALVSLALRQSIATSWVESLYEGLKAEALKFGITIAGGNVARIDGPVVIDVSVLGTVAKDSMIRRSGARVRDVLAVTGTLGDAIAARLLSEAAQPPSEEDHEWVRGLAVPEPRIAVGRALGQAGVATAMMDLSDGLTGDIVHLARASSVGAVIEAEQLPISKETKRAAERLGLDAVELALSGGEDYELLVAISPTRFAEARLLARDVELTAIGRVLTAEEGIALARNGIRQPMPQAGWRHF